MKTAIKLILIDLVIAQIAAPILVMIPYTIYLLVTTGNLDNGKPVISVCKKQRGLPYQQAICHVAHWPFSRPDLLYPH